VTVPVGREVSLTWDYTDPIEPGDYLQIVKTGRTYLVTDAKPVTRGPNAGTRWRLRAVVVPPDHPEPDDRVIPSAWWPRGRRRR